MNYKLKKFNTDLNITRIANIHYFEFTSKYHTTKNSHPFNELVYVDMGSLNAEAENYSGEINQNQMIIHSPNEKHALYCNNSLAPNVIIIGFECTAKELDFFSKNIVTVSPPLQKLLVEIIKEGRNVFLPPYDTPDQKDMKKRTAYPFGADRLLKNLLENFLIHAIREYQFINNSSKNFSSEDSQVNAIKNYIDQNYKGKTSLDELCFLFATNKTTLCKKFKNVTGVTVINYINNLKIKQAKIMMRQEKKNLTQIAEELSFSSIHYFTRMFKKYENTSPTNYLKTIKAKLN